MQHQSSTPGPEVGWAFGVLGFVATVFVGWLIDVGVGFLLVAIVFWGGIGALFAFLVERSTIEEHDRVEELQNTRLATLAPAWVPEPAPRARREERAPSTSERSDATAARAAATGGTSPARADGTPGTPAAADADRRTDGDPGGREARDAAAAAVLARRMTSTAPHRDAERTRPAVAPAASVRADPTPDAGATGRDPGRWNGARAGAARAGGTSTPRSSATPAPDPARWNGARMAASRADERVAGPAGPAGRGAGSSPAGRPGARPGEPARPSSAAPRPSDRGRRPAHPRRPEPDAPAQPQPRSPREYREARVAREDGAHEDHAAA